LPYVIPWPEGECYGIITLTLPSLFIFCLRPLARRWPGPLGELQQATGVITQKRIVHRPWIFIHSYRYIIGYRLV